MTSLRKAVFPVAGFGTRFLPATKAMRKEFLPIVDKPLIQYAVEKPDEYDAPSNFTSIGRYVLAPDIFATLRGLSVGSGGEIQLADAINIHAQQGSVETVRLNGRRFVCGSVDGFLNAVFHEAERRKGCV